MDKETLINNIKQINGLQGCMLVSKDGLVLSNSMPDSIDPNLVGAVLSSMYTNIDVQSKRMQRGTIKRFSLETEQEAMVIAEVHVDNETLLAFSQFNKDVDLQEVIDKIDNIVKG